MELSVAALLCVASLALLAACWRFAGQLIHPPRQAACQTPAQIGLAAEPVEFPSRDGIQLRGWWLAAHRPRGTLVLSHGYAGDCSPDLEYARWLTGAGYNLLYFDHRGHGRSDGEMTTFGALEARDLLGAIDWLRRRGIEQVGALGFSMGGSVVLQAAPLTEAIRCVVADCTFASLPTLFQRQAPRARVPEFLAPPVARLVIFCMSLRTRINLFAHSPEKSIARLAPRPVLLIQAGGDELIPDSEATRLYAAAGEPKELWRVEGASHRSVDKLVREEYERRITAFFDRYLAAPRAAAPEPPAPRVRAQAEAYGQAAD